MKSQIHALIRLPFGGSIIIFCLAIFVFPTPFVVNGYAFGEWPEQREDATGFVEEYVVEFNSKTTLDEVNGVLRSFDLQIDRQHPQLDNVYQISQKSGSQGGVNNLNRRRRDSDSNQLKYLQDHPSVVHMSQQEVLFREKRELFDSQFDKDAEITHNKNREIHYDKHDESEFYRPVINKKEDSLCNQAVFSDPLFGDQWQICNDGQTGGVRGFDINVVPVWIQRNITGRGVKICILDDGVDYRHSDLLPNFDPRASLDLNDRKKKSDPSPRGDEENAHGTKCAGVVAAAANNSKCGVGIAYNAKIGGIRMLDGQVTDLLESEALTFNIDYIDIFSASWGPTDDGKTMAGPGRLASRALKTAVTKGRNGLGSIFVWATGNGGRRGDDCNADGYVSNVNVISIGSVDEDGGAPVYMEECSSTTAVVFVGGPRAAFSGKPNIKMVTVSINDQCTEDFTGTSAAAPAAAGIIALMLEANPILTYRDIMHIIVNTAVSTGLKASWFTNAAGHVFSRRFGFGRLDADHLVGLALQWKTKIPPIHICESDVKRLDGVSLYPGDVVTIELETDACIENNSTRVDFAEHVQLFIDLSHPRRGDVNLTLVSPAGTQSIVLSNRRYDTKSSGIRFAFTTVHFWGEKVRGTWKVLVGDNPQGEPIEGLRSVNRVGLALLGTFDPVTLPSSFLPPAIPRDVELGDRAAGLRRIQEIGSKVELDDTNPQQSNRDFAIGNRKRTDWVDENPFQQPDVWKRLLSDNEVDGVIDTGLKSSRKHSRHRSNLKNVRNEK